MYLNGIVFRNSCEQIFKGPLASFLKKNSPTTGERGARVNFVLVNSEICEQYVACDGRGVRVNFLFEVSKFEGA